MDEERLKKIDQYLDGELSPEEKAQFELAVIQNEDLRQDVRLVQLERGFLRQSSTNPKLEKIKEWEQQYETGRRTRQWLIIGGVFLAFIVTVLIIFFLNRNKEPQPIADNSLELQLLELYEAEQPEFNFSDRGDEASDEVIRNFKDKDFEQAAAVPATELPDDVLYMRAHALLLSKQYQEAQEAFGRLMENMFYKADAQFFYIMSYYLQNPKASEQLPLLQEILSDATHPYFDEAEDLVQLIQQD